MSEFIIKYWIQVAFTAILSALSLYVGNIVKTFKKECNDQKLLKTGMQALLRDRLNQSYNYHMDKGYCAMHNKDNIMNMYNSYHHLGVNGVMDNAIKELMELPVREKVI